MEMTRLLSLKQCEELKFFADKSREEDLRAGATRDGDAELNDCSKDTFPSYLVEIFGLETIKDILEFFHESDDSRISLIVSRLNIFTNKKPSIENPWRRN
jgi:hypothetical protein